MESHCLLAIIIVHHHANGRFDWLISEQQSIYPLREAISILSEKYKRFKVVHLVSPRLLKLELDFEDEELSCFINDMKHGKVDNLDSRGLWRINESLAKVCCKQINKVFQHDGHQSC